MTMRHVRLYLAIAGASCIVGGETLCLLGPIRYERVVHVTCHLIFYAGIVSVVIAAALPWTSRR
jgi:hypothetical protein